MNYLNNQEKRFGLLRDLLNNNKNNLIKGLDGLYYTKEEIRCQLERTLSRIDGFKRLNDFEKNNVWKKNTRYKIKSLATVEFNYFIEVENAIDAFTTNNILDALQNGKTSLKEVQKLLTNNNNKMSMRSNMEYRKTWIENRMYELASLIEFDSPSQFNEESYASINALDCLLSGKISKTELIESGYWKTLNTLLLEVKWVFNGQRDFENLNS